jgi:hypothetical protein
MLFRCPVCMHTAEEYRTNDMYPDILVHPKVPYDLCTQGLVINFLEMVLAQLLEPILQTVASRSTKYHDTYSVKYSYFAEKSKTQECPLKPVQEESCPKCLNPFNWLTSSIARWYFFLGNSAALNKFFLSYYNLFLLSMSEIMQRTCQHNGWKLNINSIAWFRVERWLCNLFLSKKIPFSLSFKSLSCFFFIVLTTSQ